MAICLYATGFYEEANQRFQKSLAELKIPNKNTNIFVKIQLHLFIF